MSSFTEDSEAVPSCEFQENLNLLREIDFFSQFPMETLKVFAYLCTRERYGKGDFLFEQHDDDARAFYIVDGECELTRTNDGGEEIIRAFSSGTFVGSLALVGRLRRLFSMRAVTEVNCMVITREKFTMTLEQFPELMPKIMQNLVDALHRWEEQQFPRHMQGCDTFKATTGVTLI